MGMPGSSEYLQELMARIFGDFMQEGFILVVHDDMFVGANTIAILLAHLKSVLDRLIMCNLTLSAIKTVICPKSTIILGWVWNSGTLTPSTHKISTLAVVKPPMTCSAMRSFIGSYKALSRCIPKYASLMSCLEDATKGLEGKKLINWTPISTQSKKL